MKKFLVLLVFVCFGQFSSAIENDKSLFVKAKELVKSEKFSEAIPMLKQYAKGLDEATLKEVYLELANAYYGINNKTEAIKNIKLAICVGGLTEQEFIYSNVLDTKVSSFAWQFFYEKYDALRKEYLKKHK